MIATLNLVLRFLLELAGLAAAAYAGFQLVEGPLRWGTAIAAPLALAVFWGIIVAPRAVNRIGPAARVVIGSLALLVVAGALAASGQFGLAVGFAGLVVANNLVLAALGERAVPAGWSR